jgi:DNA-binding NtrC family response regulator
MEIKLELPSDVFDEQFRAEDFTRRVRDFAIFELLRAKRLHEHEAQRMLGLERWELVERMERAGIEPTEKVFDQLKDELTRAVSGRQKRS